MSDRKWVKLFSTEDSPNIKEISMAALHKPYRPCLVKLTGRSGYHVFCYIHLNEGKPELLSYNALFAGVINPSKYRIQSFDYYVGPNPGLDSFFVASIVKRTDPHSSRLVKINFRETPHAEERETTEEPIK
jgi:hypothetical protein